ncbi:TPR domain-containing protein [Vibrio parahaemolyticus]|uniref:TPR domain-containing protein n=1 Tax=Vibrio mediterranei TaxID=689 RepID=UPI0040678512
MFSSLSLFVVLCGSAIFIVAFLSLSAIVSRRTRFLYSLSTSVLVCGLSWLVWSQIRTELPQPAETPVVKNGETMMNELQQALRDDPNNGKNWFHLGQLYMQRNEFDAAITCFDYSIRLSEIPYAGQYAAIATAKYFSESQTMTPEVQLFIDKALLMDEFNDTALLLVASDHFLTSDYDSAITVWTKILDSNRPGIDRANIIEKINQAKSMAAR